MTTFEQGIVRPVCNPGTPGLGPLAIVAATDADFQFLCRKLRLPDSRRLFLSTICFDAGDPTTPTLAGPLLGAPYAVMVLETLQAWGVRTIIFLGWCGSISSCLHSGDILVPDSAVVDEGTSLHYGQHTGAVVQPHEHLCDSLHRIVRQRDMALCKGRVWTTDGVFRETPAQIRKYQAQGAVAVEMELSALFSAAQFYGLSLAALLIVSDELFTLEWRPGFKEKRFKKSRTAVCELLTDSYRRLNHD
ncbi:MAG: nucleoside phosphorylase [Desulfobacteraceae bacterium]|jgi:uridine phosphorylase